MEAGHGLFRCREREVAGRRKQKDKNFCEMPRAKHFLQLKRQTFEFKINKYNNSNDATTTTMTENEEKIDLRFQCQARNKFFMIRVLNFQSSASRLKLIFSVSDEENEREFFF